VKLTFVSLLAVILSASPALARKRAKPAPPAARPEDDTRLKGDAKAFARAAVAFVSPDDEGELAAGEGVRIEIKVSGYALGAAKPGGPVPHAHLIVDNEPAIEIDDASSTWLLKGLGRGPHLLRVVLCRPWHEVVKAPHAFALTRFWVGARLEGKAGHAAEFVAWPEKNKPLVTYVLPVGDPPKGLVLEPLQKLENVPDPSVATPGEAIADAGDPDASVALAADAGPAPVSTSHPPVKAAHRTLDTGHRTPEKPVLDFYLSNVKLGRRGDKLRVVIDKRELPLVTEWKPLHLRHARPGPHKLTIDLLNRKGLKVKNAANRTDRAFVASN
jgi:hypothetical protein